MTLVSRRSDPRRAVSDVDSWTVDVKLSSTIEHWTDPDPLFSFPSTTTTSY